MRGIATPFWVGILAAVLISGAYILTTQRVLKGSLPCLIAKGVLTPPKLLLDLICSGVKSVVTKLEGLGGLAGAAAGEAIKAFVENRVAGLKSLLNNVEASVCARFGS